jgi:hypothetical protein
MGDILVPPDHHLVLGDADEQELRLLSAITGSAGEVVEETGKHPQTGDADQRRDDEEMPPHDGVLGRALFITACGDAPRR